MKNSGNTINLTNVVQEFDSSYIILEFTLKDTTKSIDCVFKINNDFFELKLENDSTTSDNLTIKGYLKNPELDSTNSIDISYIGSYDVTISTKSLASNDYFYYTYNNRLFDPSLTNISKTFNLIVEDTIDPSLNFYDLSGREKQRSNNLYTRFSKKFKIQCFKWYMFVNLKYIENFTNYINKNMFLINHYCYIMMTLFTMVH